jgi:hypothetical protein
MAALEPIRLEERETPVYPPVFPAGDIALRTAAAKRPVCPTTQFVKSAAASTGRTKFLSSM